MNELSAISVEFGQLCKYFDYSRMNKKKHTFFLLGDTKRTKMKIIAAVFGNF